MMAHFDLKEKEKREHGNPERSIPSRNRSTAGLGFTVERRPADCNET